MCEEMTDYLIAVNQEPLVWIRSYERLPIVNPKAVFRVQQNGFIMVDLLLCHVVLPSQQTGGLSLSPSLLT